MKVKKALLFLTIAFALVNTATAATIQGSIYDMALNRVENAVIKINTIPEQSYVSKNGSYSFSVPKGNYSLKVEILERGKVTYSDEANISVVDDGTYNVDLILFPNFDEDILFEDLNSDVESFNLSGLSLDDKPKNTNTKLLSIALSTIIAILLIYMYTSRKGLKKFEKKESVQPKDKPTEKQKKLAVEEKKEENEAEDTGLVDELEEENNIVYDLVKKYKRITQKEIRKQVPLSEAKISLIISDLENQGKVKKIKKGRGNIIVLKK